MGKIQCVSLRSGHETWNKIENELNSRTSQDEKKIYYEFSFLREKLTHLGRRTKEGFSHIEYMDYYFDKISAKIYSSPTVSLRKRMKRFIKWYRMTNNKEEEIKLISQRTTPIKENPETVVRKVKMKKNSFTSLSSFKVDFNSEYEEKLDSNLLENYKRNKNKFISRVSKSPPSCFRWKSWKILHDRISDKCKEEIYLHFLNLNLDESTEIQIKKDLNRTLSNEPKFNSEQTQKNLYRVLRAFANLDKKLSYCQGMNFIVGFLLILSDFSEVETFFMLCALFESGGGKSNCPGIRGFFLNNFPTLKFYLYLFDIIFTKRMPNLKAHFLKVDIPNEVWISKWLQTMFTICLPLFAVVRVWDCFMCYGPKFLVSFSLCLLKEKEEELLNLDEAFDIVDCLKLYINKDNFDVESLIHQAKKINLDSIFIQQVKQDYENIFTIDLKDYDVEYNLSKPLISNGMESQSLIGINEDSMISLSSYGRLINSKIEFEEGGVQFNKRNSQDNATISLLLKTTKNTDTAQSKNINEGILVNLTSDCQKEKEEIDESVCYEVDIGDPISVDTKVNIHTLNTNTMGRLK